MIELEYFVVCRSIAVDIDGGDLTLCNVLEDVFPLYLPDYLDRIAAVSSWRFSKEDLADDHQAILRVTLPGETSARDFAMNFVESGTRYRAIQTITSIPIDVEGLLLFEVLLNGKSQATHQVTIHPPLKDDSEIDTK